MSVMKGLRRLFVLPIRAYQRLISPLTPPSCRFEPSCSEYGAQAILVHGVVKGTLLGTWRILRCHPFTPGGSDPVPQRGRWKSGP
jgi:putative membrane protein insertion efficiency factor